MRYLFALVVLLHGLIHLMGFAKAFGYAQFSQLTKEISKPFGIVWLIAAIVLSITAILYFSKNESWWIIALVGILLSQFLIILYWPDAKFGTIANLIVMLVVIPAGANKFYERLYRKDVAENISQPIADSILTQKSIAHLPEPVQRYIIYSGAVDQPIPRNFKIRFEGRIRQDEQSDWMAFTTEQYNFIDPPTRLFFMNATMKRLPVSGYHSFKNGKAIMDIRLLSLLRVQYQEGPKMNVAETVTWFNDLCLFAPGALIDERITWTDIDNHTTKATFTNQGITIAATLYFNDRGELVNFKSNDRYRIVNENDARLIPFSTPVSKYIEMRAHKVPYDGKAVWSLPDRDLTYGEFFCVDIDYNLSN